MSSTIVSRVGNLKLEDWIFKAIDESQTLIDLTELRNMLLDNFAALSSSLSTEISSIANTVNELTTIIDGGGGGISPDATINADKVYFTENLQFTQPFGKYADVETGSYMLPSNGKSLKQVLLDAFGSVQSASRTLPEFVFSVGSYTAYKEVGDTYQLPSAVLSVASVGTFQYGTDTSTAAENNSGITVRTEEASIETEEGKTTNSGQLGYADKLTRPTGSAVHSYSDSRAQYTYTATARYTQSGIPYNNIGALDLSNRIPAGTFSTSQTIGFTGQRYKFWGYRLASEGALDVNHLTSANIRSGIHCKSGTAFPTSFDCPYGTKQIIFAAPHDSVKKKIYMNHPLAGQLDFNNDNSRVVGKLSVEGKNGYSAIAYDFWYITIDASIAAPMTYTVEWTNE